MPRKLRRLSSPSWERSRVRSRRSEIHERACPASGAFDFLASMRGRFLTALPLRSLHRRVRHVRRANSSLRTCCVSLAYVSVRPARSFALGLGGVCLRAMRAQRLVSWPKHVVCLLDCLPCLQLVDPNDGEGAHATRSVA